MTHPISLRPSASALVGTSALVAAGGGRDRVTRIKVYLTVGILSVAFLAGLIISANVGEATQNHSEGILIDFAEYDVTWHDADYKVQSDPVELLKESCAEHGYTYAFTDGALTEVNGVANNTASFWNLWYVKDGETGWIKSDTYSIDASDYAAVAWAYRPDGAEPTVAVDSTGVCVYGYGQSQRIVSLSPVSSENLGTVGAVSSIVGVDYYSNYPQQLQEEKSKGMIEIVGTYTDPSFELIMKQKPDMVIGDQSQYNQVQVAKAVRQNGTNAVVIYSGEDIQTIYDNLYIVGVAIGYDIPAKNRIAADSAAMLQIQSRLAGMVSEQRNVMVALSPDLSPYVAGKGTYVNDILGNISAKNAFYNSPGWAHINTEKIASANPDAIIIVTDSYKPTQAEWDAMYDSLGDSWKTTDAYANKEIYLLCEGSTDLASRAAPRFVQLAELLADILYPTEMGVSAFPKYIGSNYAELLTITADLG